MLRTIAFALAAFAAAPPAQAAGTAAETVTRFHEVLLDVMHGGAGLGCAGRAQRLTPAIDKAFDLPALAARALRRQWTTLDESQRRTFAAVFRDLVIATYASRFAAFGGERFETLDTVAQPGGMMLVHARLRPAAGDAVSFDYVLHEADGAWKIVNVIADGVSDLALRSTQYEQIVKQRGFDGLLAELKTQTRNAATCP